MRQLKITAVIGLLVFAGFHQIAASRYAGYLWCVPAFAFLFFILKVLFRSTPATYINANGYVVLSESNELEHRYIARQVLGRALQPNEIVHHINGRKTDNAVDNLCLMDGEKHEHFHAWLSWRKNKTRRYPSLSDQKRILESEYGGTLLENIKVIEIVSSPKKVTATALPDKLIRPRDPMLQRRLFIQLRSERKRIAKERHIPAYVIFHDKALVEMSEAMPDSKHAMLEMKNMNKEKYETYGGYFIAVIRKFKSDFNINREDKKDPA